MENTSRRDDVLGALGTAVLLIGTATGSAMALFLLSGIVLILLLLFGRARAKRGPLLVGVVAAAVAAGIGIVLTMR
jgi:hypothetical protein